MIQPLPANRRTWPPMLVLPICLGSIFGATLLHDEWLPGHSAESIVIWVLWSVGAFLVLRRLPGQVGRLGSMGVGLALGQLSAGVVHDYGLFGDTTIAHMVAAGLGAAIGMIAMDQALKRSDARSWSP